MSTSTLLPELYLIIGNILIDNGYLHSCLSLFHTCKYMRKLNPIVFHTNGQQLTIKHKDVILARGTTRSGRIYYIQGNYKVRYNEHLTDLYFRCRYNRSGLLVSKHKLLPSLLMAEYSKPHRKITSTYYNGQLVMHTQGDLTMKYVKRLDIFHIYYDLGINFPNNNYSSFRIDNNSIIWAHTGIQWICIYPQ